MTYFNQWTLRLAAHRQKILAVSFRLKAQAQPLQSLIFAFLLPFNSRGVIFLLLSPHLLAAGKSFFSFPSLF